ncbi:MAG: hypothetical protein SFV15_21480 [Polyangiaceae bacterium]|nr:hypothetical protein [Polyangiaceae bacterium]
MLRSSRAILSIAQRLTFGSLTSLTLVAAASTLVGCKDENQPEYWIEKAQEPAYQAQAIKRLEQFFEDTYGRANSDLAAPEVQALVNKLVDPLTKLYVDNFDTLATKTRVDLIRLLATFRDKRAEPALKKALEEFAKKPRRSRDDADIKWAANAAADMKLPSLIGPMIASFDKLRASSMLGGITYQDYNKALVELHDKSWVGLLAQKLEPEIPQPKKDDKDSFDQARDQLFWQTTAAEVLGFTGDPSAVNPLLQVVLDPAKRDVHATAFLALVKLGKPAVESAIKVLNGEDQKLVAFSILRQKAAGAKEATNLHVPTMAILIGTAGRPEGRAALMAALAKETDEVTKAILARELAKIPATAESKQAFKAAFESIALDTMIPPGNPALQVLTEAAGQFYDPEMVTWLLDRAEAVKGDPEEKKALQGSITITALKLAKPDQLPAVKKAVDRYGTSIEKGLYTQAEKILTACGDRVGCYLTAIEKRENQENDTQFIGIKAGYMIGILGNDQSRSDLIQRLDSIDNAALRFVSAQAIDQLSPKGSKEAAASLRMIIEKNAKSPDRNKAAGDSALKQVMYRIESRAN